MVTTDHVMCYVVLEKKPAVAAVAASTIDVSQSRMTRPSTPPSSGKQILLIFGVH